MLSRRQESNHGPTEFRRSSVPKLFIRDIKAVCTETARGQRLGLFDADVSQDGSHSHMGPAHHELPLKGVFAMLTSVVVMGVKIGP
jgi:hypothetical protein